MPSTERHQRIEQQLTQFFQPQHLDLIDESHLHAGHAGAQGGAGHYRVTLVSAYFEGLSRIKRHQAVYQTLQQWMPHDIHALSLILHTPAEFATLFDPQ